MDAEERISRRLEDRTPSHHRWPHHKILLSHGWVPSSHSTEYRGRLTGTGVADYVHPAHPNSALSVYSPGFWLHQTMGGADVGEGDDASDLEQHLAQFHGG